jgi:hypothetical protein
MKVEHTVETIPIRAFHLRCEYSDFGMLLEMENKITFSAGNAGGKSRAEARNDQHTKSQSLTDPDG